MNAKAMNIRKWIKENLIFKTTLKYKKMPEAKSE